ncbi:MAG TPA: hypothetical protein VHO72_09940, partial [Bacteroidales bacterium]|nr:hypothetical protein [Bacteroidales bacterium]
LNKPEPLGPIINPARISPKIEGILILREMYGTKRMMDMMSVKIATGLVMGDMAKLRVIVAEFTPKFVLRSRKN